MIILIIILIVLFIILSAYFSGMETGLISQDRYKLEQDARNDKRKKQILRFLENPDWLFGTTLLGNNICVVILSALTILLLNRLKDNHGITITEQVGTLIMTGIILIFAEIIPKALYREQSSKLVEKNFGLLWVFSILAKPSVKLVNVINHKLTRLLHLKEEPNLLKVSREDLSFMVSESEIQEDEEELNQKDLLEEALEFGELKAENVMTHRTEIIAFEKNTSILEVIKAAEEAGFTRFPVIENDIDNVCGILIIYDILKCDDPKNDKVENYMRHILFVPESMTIDALLAEMQAKKRSLAIVVDSYGGTAGMVTIEDIIEELVGEIEDEYDIEESELEILPDGSYMVNGDMEIDLLSSKYDIDLPEGDYETVAGLIIDRLAKIPVINTLVELQHYSLLVHDVTRKKIEKVKITPKKRVK